MAGSGIVSEYKKEMAVAASIAIVGVLILAVTFAAFLPIQPGMNTSSSSSAPFKGTSTTILGSTTSLRSTTYLGSSTSLGSTYSTRSEPTEIPWNSTAAADAALDSSAVEGYTKGAYYYSIGSLGLVNPSNESTIWADVFVVGSQVVSGNWTAGYVVMYTGLKALVATVRLTPPTSYTVTGLNATNLANRTDDISFDSNQRQAIQVAVSNSTVKGDLSGMEYYVSYASDQPSNNGTMLGYIIQIVQVNGYKALLVNVNLSTTEVTEVTSYTQWPSF
jgi:hypothetical protein